MNFFTMVGVVASFYFFVYAICLWCTDCNLELTFVEKFGRKLNKLKRKVVWITRSSTELGKTMAMKVAKNRGKLAISSNSVKDLEKLKAVCMKINPFLKSRDILIFEFDIDDLTTHEDKFRKVIEHFGTLDILIINEDKWEQDNCEASTSQIEKSLFHSNVFGVLHLSRLAVKYFAEKQKGQLAVTSSIAGLVGVPHSGFYTATKHAIQGYFNCLKMEKLCDNFGSTLLCLGSSDLSQDKRNLTRKEQADGSRNKKSERKMSAERCAHLSLLAVVNDLEEVWIAVFPILPLVYGIKYYPNLTKIVLKYLAPRED